MGSPSWKYSDPTWTNTARSFPRRLTVVKRETYISNMGTRRVEQGDTGHVVAAQIRRLRDEKRLSLQELSDRLAAVGRPILPSGLSKIEQGTRRVDVDDLVALADALGGVPSQLLEPYSRVGLDSSSQMLAEHGEAVGAAIAAIRVCEDAGVGRYEVVELMNHLDRLARWRERLPASWFVAEDTDGERR
jgi:transcriptional regulator with XRE-family HTH domain